MLVRSHSGMTRRFAGVALLALSLLLSGCYGDTYAVRFRLTLAVQVDREVKRGSGVLEAVYQDLGAMSGFAQSPWSFGVRGEAIAVDLGERGLLFCLLTGDPKRRGSLSEMSSLPLIYFHDYFPNGGLDPGAKGAAELKDLIRYQPRADLDLDALPMLVRFRDTAAPITVERVDPFDLAKTFGTGVKLINARIEITGDPITTGIQKRLTWIGQYPEPSLDPSHAPGDWSLPATIHQGDFRKGIK
jgi:hypothetical protein